MKNNIQLDNQPLNNTQLDNIQLNNTQLDNVQLDSNGYILNLEIVNNNMKFKKQFNKGEIRNILNYIRECQYKINSNKLPLYIQIARDLYEQPKINLNDLAKKYNKTPKQISWIIAKSIKQKMPYILDKVKQNNTILPQYADIIFNMYSKKTDIKNTAKNLNKTAKQVRDSLRYSKKVMPKLYNFVKNVVLKKEG